MTKDEAITVLSQGTHTGKLATASESAEPHVAPVWFIVDGRDLVFTTGRDTVKGRHLRSNPSAALVVDEEQFPYTFVSVGGAVSVVEQPADLVTWTTRIAERYVPAGQAEEYGRANSGPGNLLCRLRLEHIVGVRDVAAS